MILLALLLATSLQVCGVRADGEPVTIPIYTQDQLQPEWDRLIRRRNGEQVLSARAEQTAANGAAAAVPAVIELGPPSPSAPRIVWRPSVERWRLLVDRWFTGRGESQHALALIRCESGGDPDAINPSSGTAGLLQHQPRYWDERSSAAGWEGASILDPEANIAVGAWLAHSDGWQHWSACEWYADQQGVG